MELSSFVSPMLLTLAESEQVKNGGRHEMVNADYGFGAGDRFSIRCDSGVGVGAVE